VRRLTARVGRDGAGALAVEFVLAGDPAALVVPGAGPPRPGERLWEHTCFEVFVRADGAEGYHEVNLSPSGEWQAHAFARYREGGPLADAALAPEIAVERSDDGLALRGRLALDRLAAAYARAALHLALATVLEHAGGARSYWALAHPPGRPDFHRPAGFLLRVPPVAGE
jgi:hypothetical protein